MSTASKPEPDKIIPMILSGGAGSRLWPLSRARRPKQFLSIHSEGTLFQKTVLRVAGDAFGPPLTVSNQDHRFLIAEQFRDLGVTPSAMVLEPSARNTGPAIAAAALIAIEKDAEATLLVLPSDHVINDVGAFEAAVDVAAAAARRGRLVTFGVTPAGPETGYGYILRGAPLADVAGCYLVGQFVEKPDAETARGYLEDGGYTWNSGMFLFRAGSFLDELEKFHPAILDACQRAVEGGQRDLDFFRLDANAYGACDSISIDYAVMERTDAAALVPVDMGWSDVGAWTALLDLGDADGDGNVRVGDVMTLGVRGSYIRSDKPFVAVIGVEDLVVVATDDAVLVVSMDRVQDVGAVSEWLEAEGRPEFETASRVYRPWGYYQVIDRGTKFQAKQLLLNPGAKLSLQRHNHRAEHWVVVEGTATVTKGNETFTLETNESTFIPRGVNHRLENAGETPLRLIEVQSGDYLGEDDIVRLDDVYGR